MKENSYLKGHFFAFLANLFWGLLSPIGKSALAEFSPFALTAFRMVGAGLCFWLLSVFLKPEAIAPKDRLRVFLASLFALVFNQGVYIFGLSLTSPVDAPIVATALPIVTMIVAAIYLKEPITGKKVVGILLGAMGAIVLIMSNSGGAVGSGSLVGNLFCLLSQFSFAIYLAVFKDLTQKYSPVTLNKWMFLYASCIYVPFAFTDIAAIQWATVSTTALLQAIYVVVGGTFMSYICVMTAQRILRPTVVSMYNYMQPIVATTVALFMGIGIFNWQKAVAVALVFLGVYIVTQSKARKDLIPTEKKV